MASHQGRIATVFAVIVLFLISQSLIISVQRKDDILSTQALVPPSSLRNERLDFYRQHYQYHEPETTSHDDAEGLNRNITMQNPCGDAPNYDLYFSRPQRYRSQFNEDKVLNRVLFQRYPELINPATSLVIRSDDATPVTRTSQRPTFLELGAFSGLQWSNSRFLEECLGWSNGLLIEASPSIFPQLVTNRPRTHRLSFAPSCQTTESMLSFEAAGRPGSGAIGVSDVDSNLTVKVPCGPLGPVLEDLLDGKVTFVSLDVEGSEIKVLETIDFTKVRVDIWMIESIREDVIAAVDRMLRRYRYQRYSNVVRKSYLFIHEDSPYQLDASQYSPAADD